MYRGREGKEVAPNVLKEDTPSRGVSMHSGLRIKAEWGWGMMVSSCVSLVIWVYSKWGSMVS